MELDKRLVAGIIAVAVILLIGTFAFTTQVRFTLNEELNVVLTPQDISAYTYNNQPVEVEFMLAPQNFLECDMQCEVSMRDLRTNKIIDEQSLSFDHAQTRNLTYTLTPAERGSGQALYKLSVECNNLPTLFCRTSGDVKAKSAIAAINYELNKEDVQAREYVQPILVAFLEGIAHLDEQVQELQFLAQRMSLATPRSDAIELLSLESTHIASLREKEQSLLSLWETQEYQVLAKQNISNLSLHQEHLSRINKLVSDELTLHNANVELVQEMHQLELQFNNLSVRNDTLTRVFNATTKAALGDAYILNQSTIPERAIRVRLQEQFMVLNDTLVLLHRQNSSFCSEAMPEQKFTNETNQTENNTLLLCLRVPLRLNLTLPRKNLTMPEVDVTPSPLPQTAPLCCVAEVCRVCSAQSPNPVLFIHGHGFNKRNTPEYSMVEFAQLQEELETADYIDAGELDLSSDIGQGEWGRAGLPIAVRGSYYFIKDYDIAGRSISTRQSERIENYALRLRELIEALKYRTSADEVDVVAHSMGGLVLREYISIFGNKSVGKIIFINVPHNGTRGSIADYCSVIGAENECEDMAAGSLFLRRLNAQPLNFDALNIISTGCEMDSALGDGVVLESDAKLRGTQEFTIRGSCTDTLNTDLHTNVLDPELHPEVADLIITYLTQ